MRWLTKLDRYVKVLSRCIYKIEQLLKTVMTPADPLEVLVDRYLLLCSNDPSVSNFQKILELKVNFIVIHD